MLFVCYAKCGTCRKAEKWLAGHGIAFEKRDIREQKPTAAELKEWQKASGLEWKKFFNTSGRIYKENHIKDRLKDMSEEEIIELLASDGLFLGSSAAGAFTAAEELALRPENAGKNIVVIAPDDGTKYMSLNLYK